MRLLLLLVAVTAPGVAAAYPQFQLSQGPQRCNQCHFSPAGGGLLNNYGREMAGDEISMTGDGGLLHGLVDLPPWIAIGGDLRGAALIHDEDAVKGADKAIFPMQAELYLRLAAGDFSLYLNGGYRGTARDERAAGPTVFSREHYLMWRQGPTGWYARAGRFHVPYGLRSPEHTAYIRRWLDFKLYEEPYSVSAGYLSNAWELHVSAFMADFLYDDVGQRGGGGAVYYERRATETLAYGAQAKVTKSELEARYTAGLVGKLYLAGPRLQLLAEVDGVVQTFDAGGGSRGQMVAYLGAAWFPVRGIMAQVQVERWDEDFAVKGVARDAVALELQFFPLAHVEASIYGRVAMLGSGSDDGPQARTLLFQLHYYL